MGKKVQKIVGSMSEWSGLLKDFFRQINDGSITLEMFGDFVAHRNPFVVEMDIINSAISEWKIFYWDLFKVSLDLDKLKIPVKPKYMQDLDRLIVVAQGMTPQLLYNKCEEFFPCRKDLPDKGLEDVVSSRTSENGVYAFWTYDKVGAFDTYETLEERFLHELKFFFETGKHLGETDDNPTLCLGSYLHDSDSYEEDGVAYIGWHRGVMVVFFQRTEYTFEGPIKQFQ